MFKPTFVQIINAPLFVLLVYIDIYRTYELCTLFISMGNTFVCAAQCHRCLVSYQKCNHLFCTCRRCITVDVAVTILHTALHLSLFVCTIPLCGLLTNLHCFILSCFFCCIELLYNVMNEFVNIAIYCLTSSSVLSSNVL